MLVVKHAFCKTEKNRITNSYSLLNAFYFINLQIRKGYKH